MHTVFRSNNLLLLALLANYASPSCAAFTFNWQFYTTANPGAGVMAVDNSTPMGIDCGPGSSDSLCTMASYGSPDTLTRFSQQIVTGTDGKQYFHVIVGDPAAGFAQEVYIEQGTTQWSWQKFPGSTPIPDGGGFPSGYLANTFDPNDIMSCLSLAGMGCRPLGTEDIVLQGGATENPAKVYMRQLVSDGTMTMEYLQDVKGKKPRLTQTLTDGGLTLRWKADMRALDYNTMNTPLTISSDVNANYVYANTMTLVDAGLPSAGSADWNLATDRQTGRVNAGRYTFTPGAGWTEAGSPYQTYYNRYLLQGGSGNKTFGNYPIFQPGTYTYWDGGYDHSRVKYLDGGVLDPAQNPCGGDPFCANPAPAWPTVKNP